MFFFFFLFLSLAAHEERVIIGSSYTSLPKEKGL